MALFYRRKNGNIRNNTWFCNSRVEVRFVNPAFTSVVGWAKYGSVLGLNPDQAAAFAIARKGLSKGSDIKRAKRNGEWINLYSKQEKINGLKA